MYSLDMFGVVTEHIWCVQTIELRVYIVNIGATLDMSSACNPSRLHLQPLRVSCQVQSLVYHRTCLVYSKPSCTATTSLCVLSSVESGFVSDAHLHLWCT